MKHLFRRNLLRKGSILWKMLLSTLGFICIPLISIQIFMFIKTSNEFETSNTKQHAYMLQSLSNSFQNEIDSLSRSAIRISMLDAAYTPLNPNASEYDIYLAARSLSEYNGVHPLAESVGIFYPSIDSVFLNGLSKNLTFFCDQYYPRNSEGSKHLYQFFSQTDTVSFFATSAYDGCLDDVLIVARPTFITSNASAPSIVFFTIDMDVLENWFSVFIPSSTSFSIIESDGTFIVRGADFSSENIKNESFQTFCEDPAQTRYTYTNNEAQILYKYQDPTSGRTFLASIPKNTAEEALISYATEAKAVLIASVIIIGILLVFTLYINYKPVFQLVSKHIDSESLGNQMSELDLLDLHLFSQDERIINLDNLLSSVVVENILSGIAISQEDAENHFPSASYCSFVVAATDTPLSSLQSATIINEFQNKHGGKLIITTIPNRSETIIVRATNDKIDLQTLKQDLQQAVSRIAKTFCRINMGTVVNSLNQLQVSYYDALFANKQVDLLGNNDASEAFYVLLQAFEQQIASGEHKEVLQTIDGLEKCIPTLPLSTKWYCKFEIIHTYLSAMQKSSHPLNNVDVGHLISSRNDVILFRSLRNSISKALEAHTSPTSLNQGDRQEVLLNYVNQNYLDKTLCLTSVADYLQTSIYTVSRIFKEATGVGFKEYIINKRIQRACQLLETTNMSISKIASVCAFENAEYFTVIFKRRFGMPPSMFRENAAVKTDSAETESPL